MTTGVVAFVLLVAPPRAFAQAGPSHLGDLQVGGRIDVGGAYLGTGRNFGAPYAIREYTFNLTQSKGRLRVSVDLSNRDDCVRFVLVSPRGKTFSGNAVDYPRVCPEPLFDDTSDFPTGQTFDIELAVGNATTGTWKLTLLAFNIRDLSFRARILLEMPRVVARDVALRPDLVPWLPWEFGFTAPGSANPGTAHDRENVPGDPTVSCHPVEEATDSKCLRFSAGIYNIGDGPMYIEFRNDVAFQHVYLADRTVDNYADNEARGRFLETIAGTGEWHPFHDHRHLSEFVLYELFQVSEPGHQLTRIGEGSKHGYCTISQQIRDWTSPAQDPQWASFPSGIFCNDAMTLERGWGDIYRWQRPGQYLPYDQVADPDGSMTAGTYLVRLTVDPSSHIVETTETNNVGYALIKVVDGGGPGQDQVIVCEQGLGTDPWDVSAAPQPDRFAWAKLLKDPGYVPPSS